MKLPFEIDLKNKVAVVTGGGGVLCSVFAEAIASAGASVAVLDLNGDAANTVAEKINNSGGKAIGIAANVLEKDSLQNAKKIINDAFGTVDILLNGAGGNNPILLSYDASSFVNGIVVPVDGGFSAYSGV